MFDSINLFFINVLQWIHGWVGNYGWSVVVFTLLIRLCVLPLDIKSRPRDVRDEPRSAEDAGASEKVRRRQGQAQSQDDGAVQKGARQPYGRAAFRFFCSGRF